MELVRGPDRHIQFIHEETVVQGGNLLRHVIEVENGHANVYYNRRGEFPLDTYYHNPDVCGH